MSDPTPDLFDICVVLNEATDAPLGTNLLPYAERIKAIVLNAIGNRLMPDMPDWVRVVSIHLEGGNDKNPPDVPWADWDRREHGYGHTVKEAIDEALQEVDQ